MAQYSHPLIGHLVVEHGMDRGAAESKFSHSTKEERKVSAHEFNEHSTGVLAGKVHLGAGKASLGSYLDRHEYELHFKWFDFVLACAPHFDKLLKTPVHFQARGAWKFDEPTLDEKKSLEAARTQIIRAAESLPPHLTDAFKAAVVLWQSRSDYAYYLGGPKMYACSGAVPARPEDAGKLKNGDAYLNGRDFVVFSRVLAEKVEGLRKRGGLENLAPLTFYNRIKNIRNTPEAKLAFLIDAPSFDNWLNWKRRQE